MIQIYFEGDSFFYQLEKDLLSAKKYIFLEFYIFQLKEIGNFILKILIKKQKKSNIPIKLIVDGVGTKDYVDEIEKLIQFTDIDFVVYKPFHYRFLFKSGFHRRDHRKVVLIDDKIFYTGGMNIKDVFSKKIMKENRWRDTMIRITNERNMEIQKIFDQAKYDFLNLWRFCKKRFYFLPKEFPLLYKNNPKAKYIMFSSLNRKRRIQFRKFYYDFLNKANEFIYLATPYFIPPIRLIKILKRKAQNGVDVQILTAGNTDVWLARQAGRAIYSSLLKSGVKIYEYSERIFHSKHTITDGGTLIGSSNIDYRSLFHNMEIDFFSTDKKILNKFLNQWEVDLKASIKIEPHFWEKRTLLEKVAEKLSYALKYYL